jgi:hypothetical protein
MPTEQLDATRPAGENRHLFDRDLRRALVAQALAVLGPDAATLHEVALGSTSRVDLVVVSSTLHAYEIKSDADSLRRLRLQADAISAAFPYATLLCTQRHVERAENILPPWWGIATGRAKDDRVVCAEHRPASPNPSIDPIAASRLIWRTEALRLLERHQLDHGLWAATRPVLWDRIATQVPLVDIVAGMRASFFKRALRESAGASS